VATQHVIPETFESEWVPILQSTRELLTIANQNAPERPTLEPYSIAILDVAPVNGKTQKCNVHSQSGKLSDCLITCRYAGPTILPMQLPSLEKEISRRATL
jgi:hypothetical protein